MARYMSDKRRKIDIKGIGLNYGTMLVSSCLILYFVEVIHFQSYSEAMTFLFSEIKFGIFLVNLLIVYFFEIIIFCAFRNKIISFAITALLAYIIAFINEFKMNARSEGFTFGDIAVAKEALQVVGNYNLKFSNISIQVVILTVVLIGVFMIGTKVKTVSKASNKIILSERIAKVTFFTVLYLAVWTNIVVFIRLAGGSEEVYVVSDYYNKYGLLAGVARTTPEKMEKPKGYTKDRIFEIKNSVEVIDANDKPNIIFVMNESLYDVMQVAGLDVSADPLSKVKEWQKEYTSGYFLSPQIGGGTCNVEFEVLTGCSVEITGGSTVMPYMNMIGKNIHTLVSLMNANGYDTAAFHPNFGSFFNRKHVYENMGFENSYFMENMGVLPKEGNNFSDIELYKKVIEVFESENRSEKPFFSYIITMQNHGGYDYNYKYSNNPITALESKVYSNKQAFETYANLECSSVDAFEFMLNYFSGIEEPTVIVMFGDHAPAFELFGYNMTGSEIDRLKYHTTPLLVWSNYGLPKEDWGYVNGYNLASKVLDYCGVHVDEFFTYVENEKNYATFCNYCYVGNEWIVSEEVDGKYHEMKENIWLMIYDRMFGKDYGIWNNASEY